MLCWFMPYNNANQNCVCVYVCVRVCTCIWRREQQPTPVFWPGEFHGPYSPWGRIESNTTE